MAAKPITGKMPTPKLAQSPTTATTSTTVSTEIQVRELTLADTAAAAHTLADAFATDALARYFLDAPDTAHWPAARKWALHTTMITYITRLHILAGVAVSAGPPAHGCVALWVPPGHGPAADGAIAALRSGLWRLRYQLSGEGRARFFREFLPLLHATKTGVLGARDPKAWYLVYLGTAQGARGRGLARACVEWGLRRADRDGAPVYLESTNVANVPIYRRLGFEVVTRMELVRAVPGFAVGKKKDQKKKKGDGAAIVVGGAAEGEERGPEKGDADGKVVLDIMVREPIDASSSESASASESSTVVASHGTTARHAIMTTTATGERFESKNVQDKGAATSTTVFRSKKAAV